MEDLKEKFKNYKLDKLCNSLTQEITDLSTTENKLKRAYVLMHIIEESQKALSNINTDDFIKELSDRTKAACEKSEKQKEVFAQKFSKNRELIGNLIEGKNDEFENLQEDIENKLEQLDNLIKELVRVRENMNPEEVKRSKQK